MFAKLTRIRPKIAFLVKWVFFISIPSCASGQKAPSKNEYGLVVIGSKKEYANTVKTLPERRLVALASYIHPLKSDIRYATSNNFTKQILYQNPVLYLRLEAAVRLAKVQDSLQKLGFDILIYDSYRPYSVTKKMWEIVPDDRYAANPATGSGHNRGIAIDLSLINASTGFPLEMPTGYDNFSDTAHHGFMQLSPEKIKNRELLKNLMEYFGFKALPTEWWHFSLPDPNKYPLLDLDFSELKQIADQ